MTQPIPTNVITGALGVGKTTLIKSLLNNKPRGERWAVLVNEFGEVGIDGAILNPYSKSEATQTIFIKEVPGGCMCCTSGLPMQIALNLLIAQARPHRLLIEPTGLGHPKEVVQTLCQPHYSSVIDLQSILALIDLRKLFETRWWHHPTFREQIQIADSILITKSELYDDSYDSKLYAYMQETHTLSTPVISVQTGDNYVHLLNKARRAGIPREVQSSFHMHEESTKPQSELGAPTVGSLRVMNNGEGYHSVGWICASSRIFDHQQCVELFKTIHIERLKAVIKTNHGPVSFNISDNELEYYTLNEAADSRIELITSNEGLAKHIATIIEQTLDLLPIIER